MNKVICPNCGAAIYENEAKCPFCGYINISGAEEKFMRDIQKTEDDLNQIPELQKAEYKKSMKKSSKIIFITIGIMAVIAAVILGIHMLLEYVLFSYDEGDAKAQMIWANENFPILDEMYAAGDYDGILDFMYELYDENDENGTHYTMYDWEHYYFISAYERYKSVEGCIAVLDRGEELSEIEAKYLVYDCMWIHYRIYDKDNEYMPYTDEEIAYLDECREITDGYFFGRLGFTQQEVEKLYEDARDEFGGIDMQTVTKYGKKVRERFK